MTIKDRWCSCTRLREAEEKAAKWDALVRCGDCEHATFERGVRECELNGMTMVPIHHFCSLGERRQP